jgi:hypothetical protein
LCNENVAELTVMGFRPCSRMGDNRNRRMVEFTRLM